MIIEQLIAISFAFTVLFGVVVAQVIALSRVLKSWSWYLLAGGLTLMGALRVYGLVKLPAAILKAQSQGVMPQRLTLEQWLTTVFAFFAVGCLIVGFDRLRRDLRKIGI